MRFSPGRARTRATVRPQAVATQASATDGARPATGHASRSPGDPHPATSDTSRSPGDGPLAPGEESAAELRRRRRVVGATAVVGAGVLGASLSTKPGSARFYGLTAATALTWVVGGRAAGPLRRGWTPGRGGRQRRPVVTPILTGVSAFGVFYAAALVARHIPLLDRAISSVLRYADQGSGGLVLLTTLTNGAAEEVFFRGALYAAAGPAPRRAAVASTAGYVLATTATRNPALVLASGAMGALFALQRRATGGIQAPLLTHVTWSALMLWFLPPLFRRRSVPTALIGSA